jgi:hypothetical protein
MEFYTGEKPILQNVPTWRCSEADSLGYVLDNLSDLVVKEVHGSGGYGMLIGPTSSKKELSDFEAKLRTARQQRAAVRFWLHRWTSISLHQWKRATLSQQRTISIAKKAFGYCCITAMRVGLYRWSLARKSRFVMRRASMLYGDNQRLRHCADALIRMRENATRHRMTLRLARQTSSTWVLASKRTALLALRKGARNLADKLKTLTLARLGVLTAKLAATWTVFKANSRALQRALACGTWLRVPSACASQTWRGS